jgi:hypothetical protein
MKHSRWRNRAVVVALVAIAASGIFLVMAPANDRADAGGAGGSPEEGGPAATGGASGIDALSRPANAGSAVRRAPSALQIPPGLPPVDPVDPPEYRTDLPPDTLYAEHPPARAHFADKLPFGVDDRTYVEFNRGALASLGVGSTLTLTTPDDGKPHTVRIDEIQVHPNGDKSWIGHVQDPQGEVLPAVFTQGVDSSFGSLSTRGGTYSLEAEGRLGWIANVNRLRQHQDFDQPDVLVPDPADAVEPPGTR